MGATAQVMDTRQTRWAVAHGIPESNPMFGDNPSQNELAAGGALGVAAMGGYWRIVEWLPDRGPETEWVKDVLATLPMALEGYCVSRNYVQTGFR